VHSGKNAVFSSQPPINVSRAARSGKNAAENVADLINPELLRFNRFSNHSLHSVARTNS
jgi:hypothetical protein